MNDGQRRRVLGLVGLGMRGRLVIVGVEQVREAVRRGSVVLALVASDAAGNSVQKVVPLLKAKKVDIVNGVPAAELGGAVGRKTTAVIGIVDVQLARGIRGIVDAGDA